MWRSIIAVVTSFSAPAFATEGWTSQCMGKGSQSDFNICVADEQATALAQMEALIEQIEDLHGERALGFFSFSQNHWHKQVEADLIALFPLAEGQDPSVQYGSSYAGSLTMARTYLIQQRLQFLDAFWIAGVR